MSSQYLVAGLDIGGTKISAVLCDRAGTIRAAGVVPAPAKDGGRAMITAAAELVRALEQQNGVRVSAAGVGAAGVIDQRTGIVRAASESFTDWVGFAVGPELSAALGVPVAVENDVNAFLHGELRWGAVTGARDAVGIMLGTGVGGAIALDGGIFGGPNGAAGEIGHTPGYSEHVCTCGQVGHLETLASGRSIELRYAERTGAPHPDRAAPAIAELARGGDPDAQAVFDDAGRALGLAISTAANLLDVAEVVVGGGVRGAWDVLEPALSDTIARNEPVSGIPLSVHPAALGGDGVALGAAAMAWPLVDPAADIAEEIGESEASGLPSTDPSHPVAV